MKCEWVLQVLNPAPPNSTNSVANTAYSGPAYWAGNGGQVFFRGRRTSRTGATLFRQPLSSALAYLHEALRSVSTLDSFNGRVCSAYTSCASALLLW